MQLPSSVSLAQHITSLINCHVVFTPALKDIESPGKKIFGMYKSGTDEKYTVIKADLSLFGSFAGALIGLFDGDVRSRLAAPEMDDVLRDAILEIFNVVSSAISNGDRTVFVGSLSDPHSVPEVNALIQNPQKKLTFDVSIPNYQGGQFTLLYS